MVQPSIHHRPDEPVAREDGINQDWLARNAGRIIDNIDSNTLASEVSPVARDTNNSRWRNLLNGAVVLLLGAGIYFALAQYNAMQKEIDSLQAALATAAKEEASVAAQQPEDGIETLVQENEALKAQLQRLQNQLKVAELYQQENRQTTAVEQPITRQPPAQAASPGPEETKSPAGWFVNFGSYYSSETAAAWRQRLKPGAGEVVVTTASMAEGTLYRLRIVGLASRAEAENMARQLEEDYDLDTLWVGKR